ncbi:MAG: hypothetical protein C0516_13250 [Gemmatimonas sp.]|jgi:GT2 family glycosyltransferase|nr:hypothetical protein [Gemmatimonas sp.]
MMQSAMQISVVVPVRNREDLLGQCLSSLVASADGQSNVRIVVCDNGSTDGSVKVARSFGPLVEVVQSTAQRVGGVRNDGAAAHKTAEVYAFLDSDCVVPPHFFAAIVETFEHSKATAVGCEVVSRKDGHWSERAWDELHRPGGDGPRHYINSACFCIRSDFFWKIGGFDAEKVSSEDVDICRRITFAGGSMWQSEKLAVLHLGNPQSVRGLYSRIRWHGEGIWEEGKGLQWSVTTAATIAHAAFVVIGILWGGWEVVHGHLTGVVLALGGMLLAPIAFVVARAVQHRRAVPIFSGVALMSITFPARIHGMIRSFVRSR